MMPRIGFADEKAVYEKNQLEMERGLKGVKLALKIPKDLSWKIRKNEAKMDKLEKLIAEHEEEKAKTIEEIESVKEQMKAMTKHSDFGAEELDDVDPKEELGPRRLHAMMQLRLGRQHVCLRCDWSLLLL